MPGVQTGYFVAAGLLERDGRFLLVNAKTGVPKGLWNFPGGRVDEGEAVEEAAVREVKEETGFDVEVEGMASVCHRLRNKYADNMVAITFKMRITGGALKVPEEEIAEARWFSLGEIRQMDDSLFAFRVRSTVIDFANNGFMKQSVFSSRKDVR